MTDLYTKVVLTVIAAALSLLVVQGFIQPVGAQIGIGIQRVQICSGFATRPSCADVEGGGPTGGGVLRVDAR